jgi:cytochrome oxidase Cu insertion factor (SCO1/SenC/PrrC family)
MHSGLDVTNPVLVGAFRTALLHQGLVALLILATAAVAWASVREFWPTLIRRDGSLPAPEGEREDEPPARRLVRYGFGLLWIFDGLLQAQPAMAAGLPSKVIAPAAAASPAWVQHLLNWAGTAWSFHPIQAATATVWIQVGIGIWLLAAERGPISRLAGLVSIGWALVVWVFGEAFGGVFAPGLSVLFGAPGAVLFYAVAGALLALPERHWRSAALGKALLSGLGVFFIGMAVLQAWPGRGFWQGTSHGAAGSLTAMVSSMSSTPQPAPLARLTANFASFAAGHGSLLNTVAVLALAAIGIGLVGGAIGLAGAPASLGQQNVPPRMQGWLRRLLLPAVILATVACLAIWVLVQDFGFLGGLGTDPNSMIPLLLLVIAGYLGVSRVAQPAEQEVAPAVPPTPVPAPAPAPALSQRWPASIRPVGLARGFASVRASGLVALWGAFLVLFGAGPMAMAQANPVADPIIAQAVGGSSAPLYVQAAPFALTDQSGRPVSLTSLHGKVVLLTFLDPVCYTDCPLIADEMRAADQMLGSKASGVEMVAIAANPAKYGPRYVQAFDREHQMTGLRNYVFLTGSLAQLRKVWADYGMTVLPGRSMSVHSDLAFVIDSHGIVRSELNDDPGPGTAAAKSSFAVLFTQAVEQALADGRSPS